jgi:hypothetical protein
MGRGCFEPFRRLLPTNALGFADSIQAVIDSVKSRLRNRRAPALLKPWPFPTTPEAYRARLQHSQMTLRRVSRLLVFSWGLSRCGGAWAHSPLPPPAHRRNPRQAWLPRLAAHQHQRETAGLPETLAEGPGCCPCASGALPRRLSPGVSHTEVDRKRYPGNLCEPPLVWSNFF